MKKIIVTILFIRVLTSCSNEDITITHHKAVLDAYPKLPIAKKLHEKFGGWSFIVEFSFSSEKGYREWQTVVFLNNRYEVNYVQRVVFDEKSRRVIKIDGYGKLRIIETTRVFKSAGQIATDYNGLEETIDGERLNKLFDTDFNWDLIGIKLNHKGVENMELVKKYWSDLYPMQNKLE